MTVGEVEAASAPLPEEKIHPCPKEETPVPPYTVESVEEAETTPPIAWSGPVKVPMARVVVVAFVVVEFRAVKSWKVEEPERKRLVEVALVKSAFVAMR